MNYMNTFFILLIVITSRFCFYESVYLTKCECGISNKSSSREYSKRIIGGKEYNPFMYPWLAILQINGTFHCGGSIISEKYILSAAHCWNNRYHKSYLKVIVGVHDRCRGNTKSTLLSVNKIIPHKKFNKIDFSADIMLIELIMKINFNEFVRPICLPNFDIAREVQTRYKDQMPMVIGWGKTHQNAKSPSCKPRYLHVPILSQKSCKDFSYSLFCAGYLNGGKDSCTGDSGGPLQIFNKNSYKYELIGLVSNGIGCALPDNPGLYTDVTRYLPWIYKFVGHSLYCW